MKNKISISGIAELAAAVLLTVGSLTFFSACGEHEGKYMTCHWAQNTVVLIGAVISLLALIRTVIRGSGIRTGLTFGIFALAVSEALVPQTVIDLCMMDTMQCHTTFRPAVTVISAVIAVIAGADTVIGLIRSGKEK